ncbi:MAG: hypothetical protein HZA02_08520 [Nitrospinae bacterium]|nr:hypothetical protein [Nitrospinota bacterium]
MPRKCTVCGHPKRREIDRLLIQGGTIRGIAKQFRLNSNAVHRHKQGHLPVKLKEGAKMEEDKQSGNLWGELTGLRARAYAIRHYEATMPELFEAE